MTQTPHTRLDDNVKRISVGALVTVMNVSTNTRQYYFITPGGDAHLALHKSAPVHIVTPEEPIAEALLGHMLGDKIFFRHDLHIEHIEWPIVS